MQTYYSTKLANALHPRPRPRLMFGIQDKFHFGHPTACAGSTISAKANLRATQLMRFKQGQVWRCLNDACRAELLVTETGILAEGGNPRCCCGSMMKMPYEQPRIRSSEESQEVRKLLRQLSTELR
jgi:hypothetical protein